MCSGQTGLDALNFGFNTGDSDVSKELNSRMSPRVDKRGRLPLLTVSACTKEIVSSVLSYTDPSIRVALSSIESPKVNAPGSVWFSIARFEASQCRHASQHLVKVRVAALYRAQLFFRTIECRAAAHALHILDVILSSRRHMTKWLADPRNHAWYVLLQAERNDESSACLHMSRLSSRNSIRHSATKTHLLFVPARPLR